MVNLRKEMAWAASVPQYLPVLDSFGPSPTCSPPRGNASLLFFLPARIKFTRRPCYCGHSKLKSGLKKIVTQPEPQITRLKKLIVAWKRYRYKQLRACLLEWPVGGEGRSLWIVCTPKNSDMFTNLPSARKTLIDHSTFFYYYFRSMHLTSTAQKAPALRQVRMNLPAHFSLFPSFELKFSRKMWNNIPSKDQAQKKVPFTRASRKALPHFVCGMALFARTRTRACVCICTRVSVCFSLV